MKTFSHLYFFSLTSFFSLSQAPTSMSTDTTKATIFETVDVEAEFPGGADSLRKYIIDNIIMDSIMDFSDKEMKEFIALFMDDYELKKALFRKKVIPNHKVIPHLFLILK